MASRVRGPVLRRVAVPVRDVEAPGRGFEMVERGGDRRRLGFVAESRGLGPEVREDLHAGVERTTASSGPVVGLGEQVQKLGADGESLIDRRGLPASKLAGGVVIAEDFREAIDLGQDTGFGGLGAGEVAGLNAEFERRAEYVFMVEREHVRVRHHQRGHNEHGHHHHRVVYPLISEVDFRPGWA